MTFQVKYNYLHINILKLYIEIYKYFKTIYWNLETCNVEYGFRMLIKLIPTLQLVKINNFPIYYLMNRLCLILRRICIMFTEVFGLQLFYRKNFTRVCILIFARTFESCHFEKTLKWWQPIDYYHIWNKILYQNSAG